MEYGWDTKEFLEQTCEKAGIGKDYWKKWGKQTNVSRLNVFFAPFFEKLLIKLKLDAIHTVSDTTKDDLEKFGAKKRIYVIPNAITKAIPGITQA